MRLLICSFVVDTVNYPHRKQRFIVILILSEPVVLGIPQTPAGDPCPLSRVSSDNDQNDYFKPVVVAQFCFHLSFDGFCDLGCQVFARVTVVFCVQEMCQECCLQNILSFFSGKLLAVLRCQLEGVL